MCSATAHIRAYYVRRLLFSPSNRWREVTILLFSFIMAHLYRKYMKLLDKWPVDKLRTGDLGIHLRQQIKVAFAKGESSKIPDKQLCEKYYESLDRIASDYYAKKYPHNFTKSASGLTIDLCKVALSQEGQKVLQESKLGFFAKVKESVKRIINKEKTQN